MSEDLDKFARDAAKQLMEQQTPGEISRNLCMEIINTWRDEKDRAKVIDILLGLSSNLIGYCLYVMEMPPEAENQLIKAVISESLFQKQSIAEHDIDRPRILVQ